MLKITYESSGILVEVYFEDNVFNSLPEYWTASDQEKENFLKKILISAIAADNTIAKNGYPNQYHVYRIFKKENRPGYLFMVLQDICSLVDFTFAIDLSKSIEIDTDKMKVFKGNEVIRPDGFKKTDWLINWNGKLQSLDEEGKVANMKKLLQAGKTTDPSSRQRIKVNPNESTINHRAPEPTAFELEKEYPYTHESINHIFSIYSQEIEDIQATVRKQREVLTKYLDKIDSAHHEIKSYKENLKKDKKNFNHEKLNQFAETECSKLLVPLKDATNHFNNEIRELCNTVETFSAQLNKEVINYEKTKNELRLFNRTFAYALYEAACDYLNELIIEAKGNIQEFKKNIALFNEKFGCIKISVDPELGTISPISHVYNYFDNLTLAQIARLLNNNDKNTLGLLQRCNTSWVKRSTALTKIHEQLAKFNEKGPFFTVKDKTHFAWNFSSIEFEKMNNAYCEKILVNLRTEKLFNSTVKQIERSEEVEEGKQKIREAKQSLKDVFEKIEQHKQLLRLQASGDLLVKKSTGFQEKIVQNRKSINNILMNILNDELSEDNNWPHLNFLQNLTNLEKKAVSCSDDTMSLLQSITKEYAKFNKIDHLNSIDHLHTIDKHYRLMYAQEANILYNQKMASLYHHSAILMHATFLSKNQIDFIQNKEKDALELITKTNLDHDQSKLAPKIKEILERLKKISKETVTVTTEMLESEKQLANLLEPDGTDVEKLELMVHTLQGKCEQGNSLKEMAKVNFDLLNFLVDFISAHKKYIENDQMIAALEIKVNKKNGQHTKLQQNISLAGAYLDEIKSKNKKILDILPEVDQFAANENHFYRALETSGAEKDEATDNAYSRYKQNVGNLAIYKKEIEEFLAALPPIEADINKELSAIKAEKKLPRPSSAPSFLYRPSAHLKISPITTAQSFFSNPNKASIASTSQKSFPHEACMSVQVCKKLESIIMSRESLEFWEDNTNYKWLHFIGRGGKMVPDVFGRSYRVPTGIRQMFDTLSTNSGSTFRDSDAKTCIQAIIRNAQDSLKRSENSLFTYGIFGARNISTTNGFYQCFRGEWTEESLSDDNLKFLLFELEKWDNVNGPKSRRASSSMADTASPPATTQAQRRFVS